MLSTQYRLRLEFICKRIANGEEVQLDDMIWADKLGKPIRSASEMLRKARRTANNPDMQPGSLDDFMNQMDIGDPNLQTILSTDSIQSKKSLLGSAKTRLTIGVNATNRRYGRRLPASPYEKSCRSLQSISCSLFFCCWITRPLLEMKLKRLGDLPYLV